MLVDAKAADVPVASADRPATTFEAVGAIDAPGLAPDAGRADTPSPPPPERDGAGPPPDRPPPPPGGDGPTNAESAILRARREGDRIIVSRVSDGKTIGANPITMESGGGFTVPSGQSLRMRFRFYVYEQRAATDIAAVTEAWRAYR